jgi:hypothetical protein
MGNTPTTWLRTSVSTGSMARVTWDELLPHQYMTILRRNIANKSAQRHAQYYACSSIFGVK